MASTNTNTNIGPQTHGFIGPVHSDRNTLAPHITDNSDPLQDEKYGDSSDGLWSMYLTEVEKQDKGATERWKGDTDGILVFTGLFSATVATFIIESYQSLSPDSSDTTNALLAQITQQLVNISHGTPLTIVAASGSQPFKPTASAVRVNVLWFLSLVLSLSCALSATLMQQWTRRYQEFAQSHGAPHRRGRMRAFIFDGISRFRMTRAVATMPVLLHISVFFFFAGLVDFLFPVDTTVTYFTLGWVAAFALAYVMLTILPNLFLNCPYGTPLSGFTWRLSQLSVIVVLGAIIGIEDLFRNSVLKFWRRANQHVTGLDKWREALKNRIKMHRQWLSDGLRKCADQSAKDAPSTVVTSALEWTLTALDEDKDIEQFAAGVPGFFDSHAVLDATSAILPLISDNPTTNTILGSRLYDLLKTCIMPGTSSFNDEDRKNRLRVCMKCLWYFGRAYNQPGTFQPLPSYFPHALASPEITSCILTEEDPVARTIGRCFSALVVMKLVADIKSRQDSNDEELACLSAILGTEIHDVKFCLQRPGTVELAIMASLTLGDIISLDTNAVPPDVLDLFKQTLDILFQALPAAEIAERQLDPSITRNPRDGNFDEFIASRLHNFLQVCISSQVPSTSSFIVRGSCLRTCLKSLWYCARAYYRPGAPVSLPSYFPHTLASPALICRIQAEKDPVARVIGRCFSALVATKLAAGVGSVNSEVWARGEKLACLSTILGIGSHSVRFCLRRPGTIELASMVSLVWGDADSIVTNALPPDVLDMVQQTLDTLSQTLPAEEIAELQPDHSIAQFISPLRKFDLIIISRLHNLLQMSLSGTSPFTSEVRRSGLQMCLKSLWNCIRAYHQLGASNPLPPYFLRIFATPEIIRHIRHGLRDDRASRVIGRCFQALVVAKLAADLKSRTILRSSDRELVACLTAILDTDPRMVNGWLLQPGAIDHMGLFFLALGEAGYVRTSWIGGTEESYVRDVVQQTFSILSCALPSGLNAKLWPDWTTHKVHRFFGQFMPILHNRLEDLLKMCTIGTLPVTEGARIKYLMSLWYYGIACHHFRPSGPGSTWDFFPIHFITPQIARCIHTDEDPVSRVIGRCFVSLVVNEFATKFNSFGGRELACLSAILGADECEAMAGLSQSTDVQLANIVSLTFGEVSSFLTNDVPPDVLQIAGETISTLAQDLPAELKVKLQINQADTSTNVSDSPTKSIIVSHLHDLFRRCTLGTLPVPKEVRAICLQMCLYGLWRWGKALHPLATSQPLLPNFLDLAGLEVTRHIGIEQDQASRVMGRCIGALVVNNVTARKKSHIGEKALACLSAILGANRRDVKLWLTQPGTIELVNMVFFAFSDIGFLSTDAVPSYVLDVVSQTFKILSNALPAEFEYQLQLDQTHALVVIPTGTSPILGDMFKNLAFRCLINLWRCVRTYNQPGKSVPLPSYILTFVGQAAMTGRIGAESDVAVRLVGRCIEALVVKKLVAGVKSRTDSTSQIRNEDLVCLSAIFGIKKHDMAFSLVVPTAVDLASMVSFALGDVGSLVTSAVPSEVLDVVQQTLQPDQSFARINTRDFSRIVASRLHSLLQVCMSGMSPFTNKVRRSCLRLFLKSLWNCVRAYHQLGASNPLPPYFPRTFATPGIIRHIQHEEDRDSRVIGRCFQALVVTKLAADFKSRTVRLGDQELVAYLAAILGADPRVVNGWLLQPGAIDHMGLFFLAFSEVGTVRTSWISGIEKSHVEDVVKQTFSILSRALPLRLNAELWPDWAAPEVHVFLGQFIPLLHNRLEDLLKRCTIEALPLTSTARTEYLKTLWYYGIACHHLHTPSWSTWDFFPIHFITPQISRFIHTDNNPVSRVIGRCFVSLVLNRFATKFNSFGDRELVCLSAILGTEKRRAIDWLFQPGVVQLVNMVSVVLGEVSSLVTNVVPEDVLHIVGQTVCALTQDLPADLKVELPLHSVNTLMNTFDGPTESIIVPTLLDLFKMCTLQTLPLPEEIRTSCLQLCLTALWHRGKVLHQLGASQQLLPDFLDLSDLEITRHILTEQHRASRVMGRCVEALVINLAARIKSCSNSTVQNRDEAIGRLSAFHGTENRNVTLWLSQPGAIELANMVSLALGEIGSLAADTDPLYVLDVVPQTFSTLSQALPAEINTIHRPDQIDAPLYIPDGRAPIMGETYQNHSIMCLMNLWRCVRTYNQPGNSVPLPSYFLIAFASPAVTSRYRTRTERNVAARVIGHCVKALVVKKFVPGTDASTDSDVQISAGHLACLSVILGTKSHDVKRCLRWPGAVELASTVLLALGDVGSLAIHTLPSDVLDVVEQTLAILSEALPVEDMTDIQVDPSISQLNISDGRFDRVIVSRIHNLLQMCLSATSPLTDEVRKSCLRMCLKSLWHCAKEYNQLNASKPLPSYFLVVLAAPEITHRIQTEQDPVSHVIGRCFVSLVISKLVVSFRSRTDPTAQIGDEELACLAAILDAESQDVKIWLRLPGTVALANIASLAFNKVNTVIYGMGLLDTSIRDTVQQTLGILSQSLSAELSADLRPDQTNTSPSTLSYGQFEQVALSRLYGLFETCTRQMPRLTEEIRTSCLRMCLKSLWDYGRTYHRPGASELLPSYIPLTLGGPQMISRIHSEQNHAVRMMGRCFEALIANNLAAHVKSHADSNPLISGEALECLSTILSTGKADVVLWLSWPGAVELANMVSLIFSEIHFYSDAAQSDVLDTVQQTFNILTQTLPDEFNAELWPDDMDTLTDVTDGTSPLTEPIHKSHSRMCLKNLWHCARTYNQLSISVPLPSFVRITLASPEFTRRIHAERDLTARVTGRCAYALVVNKLVDDLQSRTSLRNGVYDAELASISSIIGTDPSELLLWPRPSTAIKLQNVVFLMSGEIEALFSSSETASVDVLHIVRQTLNVICSDLVLGGAFAGGDLPTDQVLLLRSIYSRIANARAVNRFNDHTVEILDRLQQITNQLSTVEHKMRRCTSTLFDANSVRGRGNVATQPECEVGRRRSRSM